MDQNFRFLHSMHNLGLVTQKVIFLPVYFPSLIVLIMWSNLQLVQAYKLQFDVTFFNLTD